MPSPRGPLTWWLLEALARPPHELGPCPVPSGACALTDEDIQLALFACYELHYGGLDGVDDRWEWNPSLLELRARLEERHAADLAAAVPAPPPAAAGEIPQALAELIASQEEGAAMAIFLHRAADAEQFREFLIHRSLYHLKEADPHTWAIPRLRGPAKAALVEIQADEYGGGRPHRMHSELFRATLREMGLDDSYGAYADRVPAITLAIGNTMSMFGLHRRHRGAILGHLAALEMTSSLPNHRYSQGLRRLRAGATARRFFDEHVQADAVHEQIAANDMCGAFAAEHPGLAGDVLYGAACAVTLDRLFGEHVMRHWCAGRTSLRDHAGARR
ncbi:hypothetical protein Skr01_09480 [Sphaerisporangium krabiense]|uniref:Iron-containing redox enzyme family protein n=1 Tax=Sphaerisporangium krabiense TaxID=763782 RepID=A0A7W8ZCM2_9ACTN|nr:iron-containing redox enzyme family protein [Sphaerisporangium krabiense]MBB5631445.1 hypothetical protein [Sphaerisporangium krabiense]GII60863.1 hypothetical protein Skr01_09480 [Sphaerisporangium krabiense]